MPLYEFKCKRHGLKFTTMTYGQTPLCPLCQIPGVRVYSFAIKPMFVPHYNPSVGQFVSSQREFDSHLSRLSDEESERTGISHHYVSMEAGDQQGFGATDDGMDNFEREHYSNPITESLT